MFKQICFFRKRPDMSSEEFLDYYETQHSKLTKHKELQSSMPNAARYVRRYLTPEPNPVTGEVLYPGWWNCREDFDRSRAIINDPARLKVLMEDEAKLFATHSNPVCSVVEPDSPMRPDGKVPRVELKYDE